MEKTDLKQIIETISELHEEARENVKTAGNTVILKTNWQIGKHINGLLPPGEERNKYGEQILEQLAENLNEKYGKGFSRRNLSMMRKFQRTYVRDEINRKLTWTHYRFLLEIESAKERASLEQRVIRESLTSIELQRIVKKKAETESRTYRPGGKLYTYRTTKKPDLHRAREETYLDLGFGIYTQDALQNAKDRFKLTSMPAFQIHREKNGEWNAEETGREDLHLYLGYPERVVDGDTLIAKLDLGFGILHRVRLRLSGVEAPEKGSKHEQTTIRMIERRIKPCPVVLVKTIGQERYGRWLAKILYLEGTRSPGKILEEGKFLNEELIQALKRL